MLRVEKTITQFPFLFFWVIVALLYFPAWQTGFVHTASECQAHLGELNHIFSGKAVFQVSGLGSKLLITLLCKLFGPVRLLWFLLYVSIQALVAWLLYRLSFELLGASNPHCRKGVSFWGSAAFCVSPYLPEVLLGASCLGCLFVLAFILGILWSTERYIYTRDSRLPWLSAVLFFFAGLMSAHGMLSIILTTALLCFYKRLGWEMATKRKTWALFLWPQCIILLLQLSVTTIVGGSALFASWGRIFSGISLTGSLSLFSKAFFQILLFGDFWPPAWRQAAYLFLDQPLAGYLVFLALVAGLVWLTRRATLGFGQEQTSLLLLVWLLLVTLPILFLPNQLIGHTPRHMHLYLPLAFLCILLAIGVNAIQAPWIRIGIPVLWFALSLFLTLRENLNWKEADYFNKQFRQENPANSQASAFVYPLPKSCIRYPGTMAD
ncbi:MAG: hypothetical protein JST06_02335 [Bacteroidetes bacterium]|nr:hypothetical protein [Bacteroidota bacterium]MBS1628778.1 hypothetical protein [Bacteroidota bacterium]